MENEQIQTLMNNLICSNDNNNNNHWINKWRKKEEIDPKTLSNVFQKWDFGSEKNR